MGGAGLLAILAGALAAGLLRERSHFRWHAGVVGLLVVLVDALGVAV